MVIGETQSVLVTLVCEQIGCPQRAALFVECHHLDHPLEHKLPALPRRRVARLSGVRPGPGESRIRRFRVRVRSCRIWRGGSLIVRIPCWFAPPERVKYSSLDRFLRGNRGVRCRSLEEHQAVGPPSTDSWRCCRTRIWEDMEMNMPKLKDGCVKPARGAIMPKPESAASPSAEAPLPEVMMRAQVGKEAIDFEINGFIEGVGFQPVKLSDYRGRWIVLCFFPGAFTFV